MIENPRVGGAGWWRKAVLGFYRNCISLEEKRTKIDVGDNVVG